jgi:DNA repair protein RecO
VTTRSEAAIVLSAHPYRDADLLVTLLGAESGKYQALAKHARASRKRFFGGIDVFDCGTFELSVSKRNSQLAFLQSVSERKPFPRLRSKLDAFRYGSLCVEVADRFTALEDPEGSLLFRPLFLSLRSLGKDEHPNQAVSIATYFCLLALKISGFHLLDDSTVIEPDARRWFNEMMTKEAPIVPHVEEISRVGFAAVLKYIEETLGTALRCSQPLIRGKLTD